MAGSCTDVHVRVYSPENRFSMAIAHRVTPEAEPVLTQETTFHPRTSALTESFVEYRGYWLPHCYNNEGAIAEYWACREKAVVMDLSPLRKWEVLGPDAEALIQHAITRDARRLAVGHVVYTAVCNETGGMIDDATVFRLGDDNFRFIGGDPYDGVWLKDLGRPPRPQGVRQALDRPAAQPRRPGPREPRDHAELVWTPQDAALDRRAEVVPIHASGAWATPGASPSWSRARATPASSATRSSATPTTAPAVWDAIWEAGQPHGLKPLGLEALDMIRIEAGLIFAGYEFDDQVDPFEAGIGFTVKLDSEEDFVGKDALIERSAHPQRRLVGLELEGNETAGHGDEVWIDRRRVGVVTSATRSPTLRKNVALCRMAIQYAENGTDVEVGKLDGLQKRIAAQGRALPVLRPGQDAPAREMSEAARPPAEFDFPLSWAGPDGIGESRFDEVAAAQRPDVRTRATTLRSRCGAPSGCSRRASR